MSITVGIREAARAYYENTGHPLKEIVISAEDFLFLSGEVCRIVGGLAGATAIEVDGVVVRPSKS